MEDRATRRSRALLAALGIVLLAAGCAGVERAGGEGAAAPPPGVDSRVLFSKAEGYFYKGLFEDAVREYTALLAAAPAHAAAYRCRATAFAALHRDAEALADYGRAVELAPKDDDTWLGRGLFLFSRGRYAEAIEDFERASALDPAHAVPHLFRARACEKIGRLREAAEARQAYVHCTIAREEAASRERPPVRELQALGLE